METIAADVTVVGGGIAGLWTAKELTDQGWSVAVVEKTPMLAAGATTRNEGWLHAGTYHAQAIHDEAEALQVTERTVYGHETIVEFAPESIDHEESYALVKDGDRMDKVIDRWDRAGVQYAEVSPKALPDVSVDVSEVTRAFQVHDKSVNSVALCRKLAAYVMARGGRMITDAAFVPTGSNEADIFTPDEAMSLRSERFVIAAGTGIKSLYEQLTGQEMFMRYFQAHLLVTPRMTRHNYFFIEAGEAGVMNHGSSSIVGINRDGIQLGESSYDLNAGKVSMVYDALKRMIPAMSQYRPGSAFVHAVACCKPDVYRSLADSQSLNIQIMEPASNYLIALPGKMTEAPYLARQVVRHLSDSGVGGSTSEALRLAVKYHMPDVQSRPADLMMTRWGTLLAPTPEPYEEPLEA